MTYHNRPGSKKWRGIVKRLTVLTAPDDTLPSNDIEQTTPTDIPKKRGTK